MAFTHNNKTPNKISFNEEPVTILYFKDPINQKDKCVWSIFKFTQNTDGNTYTIAAESDRIFPNNLILPSTYEGAKVTKIADWGFYTSNDSANLITPTSIIIPTGITEIGTNAFYDNPMLVSVTIPNGMKTIDSAAFNNCQSLIEVVNKSDLNIKIGDTSNGYVGYYAKYIITDSSQSKLTTWSNNQNDYIFYDDGQERLLVKRINKSTSFTAPYYTGTTEKYDIWNSAFYGDTQLTAVSNQKNVILNIGKKAFYCCPNLKDVLLSTSVKSIREYAFESCNKLTNLQIANTAITILDEGVFNGCSALKSLVLPANLQTIKRIALSACTALEYIVVPKSLTTVEANAFGNNPKLVDIYYEGTKDDWANVSVGSNNTPFTHVATRWYYTDSKPDIEGYYWHYVNIDGVNTPQYWDKDSIYNYLTFEPGSNDGYALTGISRVDPRNELLGADLKTKTATGDIIIPKKYNGKNVTDIDSAFFGTTDINSVTIPNTVINIKDSAFEFCDLKEISFEAPSTVTTIGSIAFKDCTNLKTVTLPSSLYSLGEQAFYRCSSLESVTLSGSIQKILKGTFQDCSALTQVDLPNDILHIYQSAFAGCTSLEYLKLPDNLSYIHDSLFNGCSKLKSLVIPEAVGSFGTNAFKGCSKLDTIYYTGTPTQWNNIREYNSGLNDSCTCYYKSDSKPTGIDHNYWHYVGSQPTLWAEPLTVEIQTAKWDKPVYPASSSTMSYEGPVATWGSQPTQVLYGKAQSYTLQAGYSLGPTYFTLVLEEVTGATCTLTKNSEGKHTLTISNVTGPVSIKIKKQ